jgi:hypothetical protein
MPRVPTKVVQPAESDDENESEYEDFSEDDNPDTWRPLDKLCEMHWHRRCISDLCGMYVIITILLISYQREYRYDEYTMVRSKTRVST